MQAALTIEPAMRQALRLGVCQVLESLKPSQWLWDSLCQTWGLNDVPEETQLVGSRASLWRPGFLPPTSGLYPAFYN